MADSRRYKAFISYSHGDEAWARWLQRGLEGYRLPRSLRQQHPHLPARLFPLFRDRDELASGADLSEAIRAAMADSEALIVICSPKAAASRWVNEEISHFRAMGRGDRIFCLIVAGAPDTGADDCAFPPALLQADDGNAPHEPMAADATARGDGKRNALLKIAAGLLGVGVDELKRRDAQRQARFWSILATGALLIAALTIGLALYALNARREADIRRSQAENLIGFMLGDLRKNLEPIGKLELLDSVGDQAMEYFAAIGEQGSEKEMLERAKAMKQIGDVRFNQGELEPALKAFEQALAQTKALHESTPANNDYLFELGQAEFWVGYVAWQRGELGKAGGAMRRYMEISRTLAKREPANADYRLELSYAYSNLGSVSVAQGRSEQALAEFRSSAAIAEKLLAGDPGNADLAMNLADAVSWIGTTKLNIGRLQDARSEFKRAAGIIRPFHALGNDQRASDYYARLLILQADADISAGALDEARLALDEVRTIQRKRLKTDPSNRLLLNIAVKADLIRLGLAPVAEWTAVQRNELERVLRVTDDMLAAKPTDTDLLQSRTQLRSLKILSGLQGGDTSGLRHTAGQFWQDWRNAMDGKKMTPELHLAGALLAEAVGKAYAAGGSTADAETLWLSTAGMLDAQNSRNPLLLAVRRSLALNLGQSEKAAALDAELRKAGFRDPRMPAQIPPSGSPR